MKRAMWKKLRPGTLIAIPMGSDQFLIGQVLIDGMSFYLQIHSKTVNDLHNAVTALDSPIFLYGETTDAELRREVWKICGNAERPKDFYRPLYIVFTQNGLMLKNFEGNEIGVASEKDVEKFGYHSSVSPSVFSIAVTNFAKYGLNFDYGVIDARKVAGRCQS